MHKSTKITPVLRKEIFERWRGGDISQRQLAREYHVDKRVVGKIIERGKKGDFTIHSSINKRYLKTSKKKLTKHAKSPTTKRNVKKTRSTKKPTLKKSAQSRSKK